MTILFKLLLWFLKEIERYVLEPLFYLLIVLFISGLDNISKARRGNLYTPKRKLYLDGISLIFITILFIWWYWFRINRSGLIRL